MYSVDRIGKACELPPTGEGTTNIPPTPEFAVIAAHPFNTTGALSCHTFTLDTLFDALFASVTLVVPPPLAIVVASH